MDISQFAIYSDSNLTIEQTAPLVSVQKSDGLDPPNDFLLYLGSPNGLYRLQANSNPGVDPIVATIVDASPGSGHETTEVKLALSSAGLDTAVAGDPLTLGVTLLGGVSNAVEIHIRVNDATLTPGYSQELSVQLNDVVAYS